MHCGSLIHLLMRV